MFLIQNLTYSSSGGGGGGAVGIVNPSYPAGGTNNCGSPGAGGGSATKPDITRYCITSEIIISIQIIVLDNGS